MTKIEEKLHDEMRERAFFMLRIIMQEHTKAKGAYYTICGAALMANHLGLITENEYKDIVELADEAT